MTKPSYEELGTVRQRLGYKSNASWELAQEQYPAVRLALELEAELARVRGLLQRIHELFVWRVSPNKEGYHFVEADVVRETIRLSAPETPIPQGTYRMLVPDPARDWKVLYKSAAKRADDYYNIIQELDKLLTTFRQSSSPSKSGAESADIGKLDSADKSGIDERYAGMATDEKYQAETLKIEKEFAQSDWEALQGSAETGGEKADV